MARDAQKRLAASNASRLRVLAYAFAVALVRSVWYSTNQSIHVMSRTYQHAWTLRSTLAFVVLSLPGLCATLYLMRTASNTSGFISVIWDVLWTMLVAWVLWPLIGEYAWLVQLFLPLYGLYKLFGLRSIVRGALTGSTPQEHVIDATPDGLNRRQRGDAAQ